ncbi:hypothetical protein SPRG_10173 [Saprolegnia parasitica CBS 223.65]|uniref:Uncharacterized protein n=1 Tax=Saprolegnia parasitica (strain CBS 223.65) TaxID=695850 RepID=A0A067C666_SAPPC|nr:hypothetical protein SPRG_10173 [Saprolegnia parasitica CBS 223.65]KDO24640.1 hypothetical protein SPRG_10173 [Saprolegnia parasitica CBS 223.65]|eukprot:XP_012204708.1 hypothetical protein SPRG_10173 [Saprolegnia parasitica CBS 223.65]
MSKDPPEVNKFLDLMRHGQTMRSTAAALLGQESHRAIYLNQALDAFQQALVFSAYVPALQTQMCLEHIRETQVDLLIVSKLLNRQQLHVRTSMPNEQPSRRAVKVLVPALPKSLFGDDGKLALAKISPRFPKAAPLLLLPTPQERPAKKAKLETPPTLLAIAETLLALAGPTLRRNL